MRKVCVLSGLLLFMLSGNAQNRFDIVITEIMADPSPVVGLPNHEWIELKNISSRPVNLQNWRIGDASSQSGTLPSFVLQPDSFVIVCASGSLANLSAFGTAIAITSFPSLDNEGDQLFLRASSGKIIHGLNYKNSWYQNAFKKEGGWTLEMIDPANPCSGSSNWKASVHPRGGTPAQKNSIDAINRDTDPPELKRAYTTDNQTVILVFNEPVDSLLSANPGLYVIDNSMTISTVTVLPPLFDKIQLRTNTGLSPATIYKITVSQIKDCQGNTIGTYNHTQVGLPAVADTGDWIINEILFNPHPNGYDFIEFLNKSQKILDASALFIANRNSSGAINSITALTDNPYYIFPGELYVVTTDADALSMQYLVPKPDHVFTISMPSFPDDKGTVIALNARGNILDELSYDEHWHFRLLENSEGVSLERIDPSVNTQYAGNWHSAASTSGYATPTGTNSQFKQSSTSTLQMNIDPLVFSPDNDGLDDVCTIHYQFSEPGFTADIMIYDAAGRPVRMLARNSTMGINGHWNWDGLDDKGSSLPVGTYIIFAEFFNLQGKKERFKKPVVLARRLN